MKIDGSVALVTGANRGHGRAYARELVGRGAAKVYGAARDVTAVTQPGVTRRTRRLPGRPLSAHLAADAPAGRAARGGRRKHLGAAHRTDAGHRRPRRRRGPRRRTRSDGAVTGPSLSQNGRISVRQPAHGFHVLAAPSRPPSDSAE